MNNKNNQLDLTKAFQNGINIGKSGVSEHANPFRNRNEESHSLFSSWLAGWDSTQKPDLVVLDDLTIIELESNKDLLMAYENGAECFKAGMSVKANSYRNYGTDSSSLYNAWDLGWKCASQLGK